MAPYRSNIERCGYPKVGGDTERNIMALVMTKERLNEFIKTGEVLEQSDILEEVDAFISVIDSLLMREQDHKDKFPTNWGSQRVGWGSE